MDDKHPHYLLVSLHRVHGLDPLDHAEVNEDVRSKRRLRLRLCHGHQIGNPGTESVDETGLQKSLVDPGSLVLGSCLVRSRRQSGCCHDCRQVDQEVVVGLVWPACPHRCLELVSAGQPDLGFSTRPVVPAAWARLLSGRGSRN